MIGQLRLRDRDAVVHLAKRFADQASCWLLCTSPFVQNTVIRQPDEDGLLGGEAWRRHGRRESEYIEVEEPLSCLRCIVEESER